jgi:hypothetical protein
MANEIGASLICQDIGASLQFLKAVKGSKHYARSLESRTAGIVNAIKVLDMGLWRLS